jgi:hypothetical protein
VGRLGEAVSGILSMGGFKKGLVPKRFAPAVWAAGYADRIGTQE